MGLYNFTVRNTKIFFKDKGMFFTSLITPLILLVLYATFLGNVYHNSFADAIPEGFTLDGALLDGIVGGQLLSSLLAVCCVTVAFCSNLLMVQDKVSGAYNDIMVTPVKKSVVSLGYFLSSATVTLIISYVAMIAGFLYLVNMGWYLSATDVLCIVLDVFLLVMFGTALSSVIICKLKTSGQASAVGTIISAGYGFLCGAYMPISSFSTGLQKVMSFLPGTYGTSLIRNHCMQGVFAKMKEQGLPSELITQMRNAVDCNLYFFDSKVSVGKMYIVLAGSVLVLIGIYIAINLLSKKKK